MLNRWSIENKGRFGRRMPVGAAFRFQRELINHISASIISTGWIKATKRSN